VHLNIENPHFLVKQGQITKIINLKPGELLGMIEETAGTAIYNKTKVESEKMIKNKEIKLESINEILKSSIIPQMDKLKLDRKKYTAFK
jgi:structural maintenance of chromosome 2